MKKIATFADVMEAMAPFIGRNSREFTTRETGRLAMYVGSPEKSLRVIHVAGTSGKTSTCYYIRALLEEAGQKTGLTVSPHIVSIADRVQIGGQPLNEVDFCRYFDEFYRLIANFDGQPSYFEVMIVFALWVYQHEQVDYAVIETGLGGLHDSTNICQRADKVCVLTDVGFDHMEVLGNTLPEIVTQKIGIVHPGNQLISHIQESEAMDVIQKKIPDVIFIDALETEDYRERNFHLAQYVYEWLAHRDDLPMLDEVQLDRCRAVQVPGRLDVFEREGRTIVLDGAHNEQKARALVRTWKALFRDNSATVVLVMKRGKEVAELVEILRPIAKKVIATEFQTFQDTRLGAVPADKLARACENANIPVVVEPDIAKALALAVETSSLILVTGSLYAVSEIRSMILGEETGVLQKG